MLWKIRTEKNLSLRQIEEKTGIGKTTLNNIENGITSPRIDELEKIAICLECGILDLIRSDVLVCKNKTS